MKCLIVQWKEHRFERLVVLGLSPPSIIYLMTWSLSGSSPVTWGL